MGKKRVKTNISGNYVKRMPVIGTLRTDNAVVWKTLGPKVGLGRAPRTKRGKYVVKIKNAIIYTNSHRLENSKTLFTFPDKNDSKLI